MSEPSREAAEASTSRDLIPSVTTVIEKVLPHEAAVTEFGAQMQRVVISDVDTYRKGEEGLRFLKRLADAMKRDRADLLGPLKEFTRWVEARIRAQEDKVDVFSRALKAAMLKFREAEDRREQEEAARVRKEQEDRALEAAAKAKSPEIAEAIMEAAIEAPAPTSGLRGIGTSTPKRWIGTAVDTRKICLAVAEGKLPAELVEFSQANLNAFAKRHEKEEVVLGIKVEHKMGMTVRS
jgi:hypothetical protein